MSFAVRAAQDALLAGRDGAGRDGAPLGGAAALPRRGARDGDLLGQRRGVARLPRLPVHPVSAGARPPGRRLLKSMKSKKREK